MKDIKHITNKLAFRIILPVSILVLIAGIILYIFVLRYISDFTNQHIKNEFLWAWGEIYTICDKSLNELLKTNDIDNEKIVRIKKGLTISSIEDFLHQNRLKGIITENKKELLSCCNTPEKSRIFIDAAQANTVSSVKYDGIEYYTYQADFEPWSWQIIIIKDSTAYSSLIDKVKISYLSTGISLTLAGLLILCYLNRAVKYPINNIITSLKANKQPEYKGIYEFEFLSNSVAEMMEERQRMIKHIMEEQKLKGIRILASGVAHNFNNMLVGVLGYASLLSMKLENAKRENRLLKEEDLDELLKCTKTIETSAQKASTLARELSGLSRKKMLEGDSVGPVDINKLVTEMQRLLSDTFPKNIEVIAITDNNIPVITGDGMQLEQALLNIAINSKDAMPDGGKLTIQTSIADIKGKSKYHYLKPGRYAAVQIRDTGTGMDEDTLNHIFEPFFTTKPVDKGTGLGLATVYSIIKAHDGYVIAESTPGKGSLFTIYLPIK
ncbi:hypothetical protein JZK55_01840 [Dissulfurispira thermophila]|uniref:histidine kinase n=1 Tax=Dissulfurispira thermophila TaxID=2715679 RepID=A0A7G1GYX0_9BACT|nr:ATP-binding protein [Dissulfurispira thermophila]BCB95262.1 hypothetical protein JZK55_01840 [Dissulfurispira thermophila]